MANKKKAGTAEKKTKEKKKGILTIIDPSGGRPTAYRKAMLPIVKKLIALGATDADIADVLNVEIRTLYRWKVKHKEFCQALKDWKRAADERVIRSLYQRAVGYTAEEDRIFHQDGKVVVVRTLKHYPPDPASCFGWLYNRQPEHWKAKREDAPSASAEELASKIKGLIQSIDDGIPLALPPNGGNSGGN